MTDMRATERLLEVIQEHAERLAYATGSGIMLVPDKVIEHRDAIIEAITELRRRGDTLVRAADLRFALEASQIRDRLHTRDERIDRLENAIGGKP